MATKAKATAKAEPKTKEAEPAEKRPKGFVPDPDVLARKMAVGLSKAEALEIMERQFDHDGNQE